MKDTLETYIKMCDCPEIQDQWKPRQGDVFTKRSDWQPKFHLYMCNVEEWTPRKQDLRFYIWLPHQGQIQEMLGMANDILLDNFNEFLSCYFSRIAIRENFSMEQLWLMFYMHKNHNKIWDGENWVKE